MIKDIFFRFLGTGASYADLAFRFQIGATTLRNAIMETIDAINLDLVKIMLPK